MRVEDEHRGEEDGERDEQCAPRLLELACQRAKREEAAVEPPSRMSSEGMCGVRRDPCTLEGVRLERPARRGRGPPHAAALAEDRRRAARASEGAYAGGSGARPSSSRTAAARLPLLSVERKHPAAGLGRRAGHSRARVARWPARQSRSALETFAA